MRPKLAYLTSLIVAFGLLTSCANQESGWTNPLDQKFIADVAPIHPPDSRNLRAYALTLPIFEMTDQDERILWVTSSDLRIETPMQLVLVGDGAQSSIAIQRASSLDSPDQKIRLTVASQGGGPDPTYELIRVPGGWRRTGVQRREGAWDDIYQLAKGKNTVIKAQQAASSNP